MSNAQENSQTSQVEKHAPAVPLLRYDDDDVQMVTEIHRRGVMLGLVGKILANVLGQVRVDSEVMGVVELGYLARELDDFGNLVDDAGLPSMVTKRGDVDRGITWIPMPYPSGRYRPGVWFYRYLSPLDRGIPEDEVAAVVLADEAGAVVAKHFIPLGVSHWREVAEAYRTALVSVAHHFAEDGAA